VDIVRAALVAPFADMVAHPAFLAEVLLGGIAAGLMYSLVALGFVLIFKASGVFNFAQGALVLFSALTLVGLMERGVPVWLALGLTVAIMVALAFGIERIVLRPLVNQEHIILFMATIGLNFFLEGFGEMVWGANVKKLDIGIPDRSFMVAGVQVNQLEMSAAAANTAASKGVPTVTFVMLSGASGMPMSSALTLEPHSVSPNPSRKKVRPMVAMNRMICSWLTMYLRITRSMTTARASMMSAVSTMASSSGTPRSIRPTSDSAANSTITPWAKLNTPEAL
jgi:hypothetical protein